MAVSPRFCAFSAVTRALWVGAALLCMLAAVSCSSKDAPNAARATRRDGLTTGTLILQYWMGTGLVAQCSTIRAAAGLNLFPPAKSSRALPRERLAASGSGSRLANKDSIWRSRAGYALPIHHRLRRRSPFAPGR